MILLMRHLFKAFVLIIGVILALIALVILLYGLRGV